MKAGYREWAMLILAFGICHANGLNAQTAHSLLRKGDQNYLEKKYGDSESSYRKALERKDNAKGQYNLGNAIYQQKRYQEALTRYQNAAKKSTSPTEKAAALHNLGNTYYQLNELKKSVEAYKEALRLNPNDKETKFNLALAQQRKKQEEQKKQQRPQEGDNKNQAQNQPPPPSNQGQKPNQDPQQGQQSQKNQGQPQDRESQSPPQDLSQKEAENLLKIMDEEERKVQGKMKKAQGRPKSGKDW
jgi:tetratricopeptide (TPR) repeat protein